MVAETGSAGYVARWRPSSVSAEAAAFAREVIGRVAPDGPERAKNLLWAAGKLADYAIGLGLDAVPEVLLHPSVTERFTRCAPGLSPVARRTLRTNLRFVGRRVVPQFYPADMPLPRERSKQPYDPAQVEGYLALADAQPTAERRMRAAGLVCLGAGAGLIRGDLRDARGTDVACRSGGVVVTVRGTRPRTVPVLARYHAPLLAAARSAGTGLICGGADPGRRNITNPLIAALDGGAGLPRLDTSRLRATWLRDCAELRTKTLPAGDPLDPATIIGPLVTQAAVDLMDERVKEAVSLGATLHTGGTHEGLVYHPTILTGVPYEATASDEETFGPLVIVEPVDTPSDAVAVANRVRYGLTSTILAADTYKAFELAPKILHGIVNVNSPTVNDEIHAPMGGVRESGWGRTGPDSLADFTDVIWINTTSSERQFPF